MDGTGSYREAEQDIFFTYGGIGVTAHPASDMIPESWHFLPFQKKRRKEVSNMTLLTTLIFISLKSLLIYGKNARTFTAQN
jgi:hypothetical protein